MKSTGIVRRVDELGRVQSCIFCGNTKNLIEHKGKLICDKCIEQISSK